MIDFETAALSPENQLPAQVLRLRAQIALGQFDESLAEPSIEEDSPDLSAVRALALQSSGNTDAALQLYFSVSLIVQIHLQQNRTDLALKEVQAAKRWGQDSLLVNVAESWVGLRVVC